MHLCRDHLHLELVMRQLWQCLTAHSLCLGVCVLRCYLFIQGSHLLMGPLVLCYRKRSFLAVLSVNKTQQGKNKAEAPADISGRVQSNCAGWGGMIHHVDHGTASLRNI